MFDSPIEALAREAALQGLIFIDYTELGLTWSGSTALNASQSLPLSLQIGSQGDFVIQTINLVGAQAGALVTNPNLLINMVDNTSNRLFQNQSTHVLNVAGSYGTQRVPGHVMAPKMMLAMSSLEVTLTDLSAVNWNFIYLAFVGFRIYYQGGTREQIFHIA